MAQCSRRRAILGSILSYIVNAFRDWIDRQTGAPSSYQTGGVAGGGPPRSSEPCWYSGAASLYLARDFFPVAKRKALYLYDVTPLLVANAARGFRQHRDIPRPHQNELTPSEAGSRGVRCVSDSWN
jgi:hypothetical protein